MWDTIMVNQQQLLTCQSSQDKSDALLSEGFRFLSYLEKVGANRWGKGEL